MTTRRNPTIRQLPSGVPGLDTVLGGGLPEYSFNLIAGGPRCASPSSASARLAAVHRAAREAREGARRAETPSATKRKGIARLRKKTRRR
jgi:hypothetical protein